MISLSNEGGRTDFNFSQGDLVGGPDFLPEFEERDFGEIGLPLERQGTMQSDRNVGVSFEKLITKKKKIYQSLTNRVNLRAAHTLGFGRRNSNDLGEDVGGVRNVNGKLIRVRSSTGNRSIVDYSNLKEKVGIGEELRQKAERLRAERLKDPDRDRKLVFPKNEHVIKVMRVCMRML